jgi:hypothetical protein
VTTDRETAAARSREWPNERLEMMRQGLATGQLALALATVSPNESFDAGEFFADVLAELLEHRGAAEPTAAPTAATPDEARYARALLNGPSADRAGVPVGSITVVSRARAGRWRARTAA